MADTEKTADPAGRDAGDRVWQGRLPVDLDGLYLWSNDRGWPMAGVIGGMPYATASTVASAEIADVPAYAVAARRPTREELLDGVPVGFGLRIDAGTGDQHSLTAEQVNAFRGSQPPRGDEAKLRVEPPPPQLHPMTAEARKHALAAGAHRVDAAWVRLPNGAAGLVLAVKARRSVNRAAALDAVFDAVRRHAPRERVRVVWLTDIPGQWRRLSFLRRSR